MGSTPTSMIFSVCVALALFTSVLCSPLRIARTAVPISDTGDSNSIEPPKDSTKQDLAPAASFWGLGPWGPPPPWAFGPGPFGPGPFGPFGPGPFGPGPFGPGFGPFG